MTDWYVNYGNGSSTGYYAVAQWAASHAYNVGDIVRQLATPAVGSERCFRCTTAGTSGGSEPAWNLTNNSTTTSGTATFTAVTGQATYNWSAPFARLASVAASGGGFAVAGDRIFVGNNHAETQSTSINLTFAGTDASPLQIYCVSTAGSIPPVNADLATTGSITCTGSTTMTFVNAVYCNGLNFSATSGATGGGNRLIFDANANARSMRFDNCTFAVPGTTSGSFIVIGLNGGGNTLHQMVWNNCSISFGSTGNTMITDANFYWNNSVALVGGSSVPTTLFTPASTGVGQIVCDGVDLSGIGSGSTLFATSNASLKYQQLINCRLNASVTISATPTTPGTSLDLVVSDSGSSKTRQERYQYGGTLTTETTFTRVGGATDPAGDLISWKMVSTANSAGTTPLASFPITIWNPTVGSSVTATVEIESQTTLTNSDIYMVVEYLGNSSYPLSSQVSTRTAFLATAANVTSSAASWNGSLSSAVTQKMQASFTPQLAGFIRVTVYLAKASQTVYVDPLVTLT